MHHNLAQFVGREAASKEIGIDVGELGQAREENGYLFEDAGDQWRQGPVGSDITIGHIEESGERIDDGVDGKLLQLVYDDAVVMIVRSVAGSTELRSAREGAQEVAGGEGKGPVQGRLGVASWTDSQFQRARPEMHDGEKPLHQRNRLDREFGGGHLNAGRGGSEGVVGGVENPVRHDPDDVVRPRVGVWEDLLVDLLNDAHAVLKKDDGGQVIETVTDGEKSLACRD